MQPRKNGRLPSREIPELVTGVGALHHRTRPLPLRQVTTTGSSASPYKGIWAPAEATQRSKAFIVIFGALNVRALGEIAAKLSEVRLDARKMEGGETAPASRNRNGKLPA